MNRISNLKSLLTKEWNTGKYTYDQFQNYVKTIFIYKYNVSMLEWSEIHAHATFIHIKSQINKIKKKTQTHDEWYVYFYFLNENINSLCYIGKTYNVENRLKQHIRDNEKFKQVKYVLCCSFNSEKDALDFEAYYTRHLQPIWNIDNKESPSKLYKLPSQKIIGWCEKYPNNLESTLNKLAFENNELVPKFQKVIDYISL